AAAALGALAVEHAIRWAAGPLAWPLLALAAWPALAQRSLDDHVRPVIAALARDDLPAARKAVGMIVGRDTA
ncbi:cobalamin biosynthesis protein, partial [Novosphingobium sp. UBA1939]|uniref:cobalamin biosynthesis protein n=1 Tax=Novosphingobium sp. UBA1939 TaxID=1946982 RepID=UPI0025D62FC5